MFSFEPRCQRRSGIDAVSLMRPWSASATLLLLGQLSVFHRTYETATQSGHHGRRLSAISSAIREIHRRLLCLGRKPVATPPARTAPCSDDHVDLVPCMTPVALYSPDPARGWLPWAWLTPILM
ncbi:hypothetical protein, partial [Stenotrophomonas bentonitica]|uniref:hypothetical protein n=1 Tax=Stenotrophomonas bentonitica TaxID=1450134 RepID=UPI0011AF1F36